MYSFIFCLISINSIFSAGEAYLFSRKTCVTSEGGIDLNPLIDPSSNYKFVVRDLEFHINICRPLVKEKKDGEYCPDDAAACMFKRKNGELSDPVSLGLANDSPTLASDGIIDLIYEGGPVCEENKEQQVRTKLSFWCDHKKGNAVRYRYKNCTHIFNWNTEVACGEINDISKRDNRSIIEIARDFPSLSFVNEELCLENYLWGVDAYTIPAMVMIDFCGIRNNTNGFIYTMGTWFRPREINIANGFAVNIVTNDSDNSIRMEFTRGSTCHVDGYRKAQSSITFICPDDGGGSLDPLLVKDERCNVEFEWRTREVCQRQTSTVIRRFIGSTSLSGFHVACIGLSIGLTLLAIIHQCVKRLNFNKETKK